MNAPIALDDIVFAEMLWAAFKSLFSVAAIMLVIFALGISRAPTLLLALPLLGLVGITFASIALVFNALAKGYDFFTYYFTLVITPMTFLSGVYFPIAALAGQLADRLAGGDVDDREQAAFLGNPTGDCQLRTLVQVGPAK